MGSVLKLLGRLVPGKSMPTTVRLEMASQADFGLYSVGNGPMMEDMMAVGVGLRTFEGWCSDCLVFVC